MSRIKKLLLKQVGTLIVTIVPFDKVQKQLLFTKKKF